MRADVSRKVKGLNKATVDPLNLFLVNTTVIKKLTNRQARLTYAC